VHRARDLAAVLAISLAMPVILVMSVLNHERLLRGRQGVVVVVHGGELHGVVTCVVVTIGLILASVEILNRSLLSDVAKLEGSTAPVEYTVVVLGVLVSLLATACTAPLAGNARGFFRLVGQSSQSLVFEGDDAHMSLVSSIAAVVPALVRACSAGCGSTTWLPSATRSLGLMHVAEGLVSVLLHDTPFVEIVEGSMLQMHGEQLCGFREFKPQVLGVRFDVGLSG